MDYLNIIITENINHKSKFIVFYLSHYIEK